MRVPRKDFWVEFLLVPGRKVGVALFCHEARGALLCIEALEKKAGGVAEWQSFALFVLVVCFVVGKVNGNAVQESAKYPSLAG